MNVQELVLTPVAELRKKHQFSMFDALFVKDMSWQMYMDEMRGEMVVEMSKRLFGQETFSENSSSFVQVPADWWQALRERWAPKWWLRRYPVVTREIDTVRTVKWFKVCPEMDGRTAQNDRIQFFIQDDFGPNR